MAIVQSDNFFKFIYVLRKNKNKLVKTYEILDELEMSQNSYRVISRYKEQAKLLGYNIETVNGYRGGTRIIEDLLSKDELSLLKDLLSEKLYNKIKNMNDRV